MLRKGDRVPAVTLAGAMGGPQGALRGSRGPRVFVTLHDVRCPRCIEYVAEIGSIRDSLEGWGADVLVIGPEGAEAGAGPLAALEIPVLEDPTRLVASGRLAVIIADRWGEVYFASDPDGLHDAIPGAEVLEWVKFVSIQCPECEGPEGEWRHV